MMNIAELNIKTYSLSFIPKSNDNIVPLINYIEGLSIFERYVCIKSNIHTSFIVSQSKEKPLTIPNLQNKSASHK